MFPFFALSLNTNILCFLYLLMSYPTFHLSLPNWITQFINSYDKTFSTIQDRMQFVISLSNHNIENETGGPFAAAIFDMKSNRLVCPGVNLVPRFQCSVAHAEIVAITLSQMLVGSYDLSRNGHSYELVTSTEPCAMCLGAIAWSGVRQVVYGASSEDAEKIGFIEGHKPPEGTLSLEHRGVRVISSVLREAAVLVLEEYSKNGGVIYNCGN